ncbi:saccharopine dehydrogenase family protein [Sporomusa acidovorans]|uniref:Carboxynorspermidine synthase n=1 Tax=Sporomusa acidovorans (strain ATCC 49682 / DSM 3132 / Mol) TaxID=1123286 RepID=A0ABZ3J8T2_SPOA4|nr:saccharopine dehydrogenase family protein [Sporomusa acidovorans]OZC24343.1 carboxynorspermidine synthase [Sporomusa acidovorans DSM 3132]SDF82180.1 carboxynorspermidine dehydrogenase [Sporomusa acidovorans]
MRKNVLIVGAGGVGHVVAHKCAMNNNVLGDICIASRTQQKCDAIIESIRRKNHLKDETKKLYSRKVDAMNIPSLVQLIKDTQSEIVINVGQAYVNMSVLEACIETGAVYMDTAIHEEPDKVCENPPWYANYEWKRRERCAEKGVTAILGIGFDPGVVNAWCALAQQDYFDHIDTIDILDVNAGSHGKFFATNFDPEINFREFRKVWTWIDRKWVLQKVHSIKMDYDFPVVGNCPVYLTGHDELHSLSKNMDAHSIRFWMGFSEHYINVFTVLTKLGLTSEKPVKVTEGVEIAPLKVLKALLPDPSSLAPGYVGKTCIGNFIRGTKDNKKREIFIYNICDHAECYQEVESQAISYTAGVPPVAAAILVARGEWDVKQMVNVEELNPQPFIKLLTSMGLPTEVLENPVTFEPPVIESLESV